MAIGALSGAAGYGAGSWAGGLVPALQVTTSAAVAGSVGGMGRQGSNLYH